MKNKNHLLSMIILTIIFYNYSYAVFNVKYSPDSINTKQQHKHNKRSKKTNRHQFKKHNYKRRLNHHKNFLVGPTVYPNTILYDNYYGDSLYNNEFEILGSQLANYSSPRECYNQCTDKCFKECTDQGGWAYQCRPNCNKNCAELCNYTN